MTISTGEDLPNLDLMLIGDDGLELLNLIAASQGRRIAIFGLPGAFTGTCSSAHVPSFIRNMDGFAAKGIDDVYCVSVNDPKVMLAWGLATGGLEAGLTFLADPECRFTQAIGMRFDAPAVGLIARSRRFSMVVADGVVQIFNKEEKPGVFDLTSAETLLSQI